MSESSRILDPAAMREFILAGAAVFTICSTASGARFTYKVTRGKASPQWPKPKWFVKVLTGGQEEPYTYIGTIDEVGRWQHGGKSPLGRSAPSVVAFGWAWTRLGHPQMEFWHEGKCGKCGQPLTVPESIARGLGPSCSGEGYKAKRVKAKITRPVVDAEAVHP